MKELVFVYGSLKQGHHNHEVIKEAGGSLINPSYTISGFEMYDVHGWYPAAYKSNTNDRITGEVYLVEDMTPLDILEGYPNHYNRSQIDTDYGPVWIYHYTRRPTDLNRVENGVWRPLSEK